MNFSSIFSRTRNEWLLQKLEEFDNRIQIYEESGQISEAVKIRLKLLEFLFEQFLKTKDPELRQNILLELNRRFRDLEVVYKHLDELNKKKIHASEVENSKLDFSIYLKEPKRRLEDLKGNEIRNAGKYVIELIKASIELRNFVPALNGTSNIANFLLIGKPGTGKSHFAEGIAYELIREGFKVNFIAVTGADIKSKYYGESQKNLANLLRWADKIAENDSISIVFIDEFDEIATRNEHRETAAITNTLLALTDGVNAVKNVVIIAATNLPEKIDPAIYSRFNVIRFKEPDSNVKIEILRKFLGKFDGLPETRFVQRQLEEMLTGMSGRDLKKLAINAITLARLNGRNRVYFDDIVNAIKVLRGDFNSVSFTRLPNESMRQIDHWRHFIRP